MTILNEAAAGIGFFSFPPSPTASCGCVPLVARSHEKLYPALSVEALRVALGASSFVIRATGASGEADTGQPAMTALKVGDFEVPTGPAGEFRIYFSGLPSMARDFRRRTSSIRAKSAGYADRLERQHRADRHQRRRPSRFRGDAALRRAAGRRGSRRDHRPDSCAAEFLTRPDWAPGAEIVVADRARR